MATRSYLSIITLNINGLNAPTKRQRLAEWIQKQDSNNNPVYETAKETLMYRTVLWTLWERERVGRFGRMALKHVKYHV